LSQNKDSLASEWLAQITPAPGFSIPKPRYSGLLVNAPGVIQICVTLMNFSRTYKLSTIGLAGTL